MDQVFKLGWLRDQVVRELRAAPLVTSAEALAGAMGLPVWAVEKGLETAQACGLVSVVGTVQAVPFWSAVEDGGGASAAERSVVANISVKDNNP